MPKVMIVEDDNSLREIYSIRLTAEGYEVVSAADGEEALAMAVREKPNLILSDVMMPKISGFDMLDILRQTPETRDIKVIMMTALSSEDQRARGEGLGADKYLVKSQVGIEDVINSIHEVLSDKVVAAAPAPAETAPAAPAPAETAPAAPAPAETAPAAPAQPVFNPETMQAPAAPQPVVAPATPAPIAPAPVIPTPTAPVAPAPVAPAQPVASQPVQPAPESPINGINPAQ